MQRAGHYLFRLGRVLELAPLFLLADGLAHLYCKKTPEVDSTTIRRDGSMLITNQDVLLGASECCGAMRRQEMW